MHFESFGVFAPCMVLSKEVHSLARGAWVIFTSRSHIVLSKEILSLSCAALVSFNEVPPPPCASIALSKHQDPV